MTAIQLSALQGDIAREILNINDGNVLVKIKDYLISLRSTTDIEAHIAPPYTMEELDERLDAAENEIESYAAQDVFTEIEQKYGWA